MQRVNYDSVRNDNSEVAVTVTSPNNDVNGSGNFIESFVHYILQYAWIQSRF